MGEFGELGPIDIRLDDHVKYGERGFSPLDEFKSLEFMREQAIEWMDYYAVVMNHQYGMSIQEALKDSIPLVSSLMRPMLEQIDPIEMGGYRRSLAIGEDYAKRMLSLTGNPDAHRIVKQLVWEYPSHDFCIDFEEAEAIGLPVKRLSDSQDHELSEAIIGLDKEHYHGFAPTLPATQTRKGRKPVRESPISRSVRHRVYGSNGSRAAERLTS